MKPLNVKEFIELIERYESITLEEILSVPNNRFRDVMKSLTGFGTANCVLCAKGSGGKDFNCKPCVYSFKDPENLGVYCLSQIHAETYNHISNAYDAEDLLNAYRERAKHMRSWLKKRKITFPVTQ